MDKEKKVKTPKERADKYESKLAINGTFEEVLQVAFIRDKKPKEAE